MSTPRTDEVETANKFPASKEYYEMVVHARALEAELTAAKERLRSEAMDDYASIQHLQRELATLIAERDQLRASLATERVLLHWRLLDRTGYLTSPPLTPACTNKEGAK